MVHTIKNTEKELINGIKQNDSSTIRRIYKSEFNRIKSMVTGFRNIQLEPEDIFQEGLTRAIINVRNGSYKGESKFSTYLYGICRNLCLKEYNRKKPYLIEKFEEQGETVEPDNFDLIHLILKVKRELNEDCISILNLRFGLNNEQEDGMRFEEIAKKLGIDAANARQRFKRCMDKIKVRLNKNPLFHELTLLES